MEHNSTQRWSMHPADGGNLLTARVVTVQSVDGRCLTGRPGTGGITVVSLRPMATTYALTMQAGIRAERALWQAPCAPANQNAAQLWWLNRNSRTVTALVSNASSSDPAAPIALEVNASDWRSVSLQRLAIPTSNSGVPVSPLQYTRRLVGAALLV